MNLTLVPSGMEIETKTDGVDALNENKLEAIDLFLFKSGETTAAVHKYITGAGTSVTMELSPAENTALGGTDFDILVVANLPAGTTLPTPLSKTKLESIALSMDGTTTQKSFVMRGEATTSTSGGDYAASVTLARVAAKFSFKVTVSSDVPGSLDGKAGPWNLDTSKDIELKFGGLQKTGVVGGTPVTPGADDLLESDYGAVSTVYYSYPRAPKAEQRPCAIIKLPFINGSSVRKDVYYKVFYPRDNFDSNVWYSLEVNIQELGATSAPEAPTIPASALSYSAASWKVAVESGNYNQNAIIKDSHFLMVYEHSYTLDNVNSIEIPFTSSRNCEVECKCTYNKFNGNARNPSTELQDTKYTVDCQKDKVILTHTLNNNINSADIDYSTYNFVIDIYHKDHHEYHEQVTVHQKPALVVDAEENTADVSKAEKVSVFVNGAQNSGSWYNVNMKTKYNNPFLYIVEVSKTDNYIIGDPRQKTYKSGTQLGMASGTNNMAPANAPAFYIEPNYYADPSGHKRQLLYYYPTRDDESASNMLAPKFKIASANSNCSSNYLTYETVQRRCAGYQEFGSPAGRWRVPTGAELNIICQLTARGVIAQIFTTQETSRYWANDGIYMYNTTTNLFEKTTTETNALVRCVYDEWYWEQSELGEHGKLTDSTTPTYTTFVWGDMPMENFK